MHNLSKVDIAKKEWHYIWYFHIYNTFTPLTCFQWTRKKERKYVDEHLNDRFHIVISVL